MIARKFRFVLLAFTLPLAGGCSGAVDSDDPSWLRANISAGGPLRQYDGAGTFHEVAEGGRREFALSSASTAGTTREQVAIFRMGGARPEIGVYPLAPVDQSDPAASGFTAWYQREGSDLSEAFVATSGTLRITESNVDRVSGTFDLTAAQYCVYILGRPGGGRCGLPWVPLADASSIQVSGEFSVRMDDGEVQPLEPPVLPIP